jgi:hypothetical protein
MAIRYVEIFSEIHGAVQRKRDASDDDEIDLLSRKAG